MMDVYISEEYVAKRRAEKRAAPTRNYGRAHLFSASRLPINAARSQEPLQPPASEFMMDVYISEEYVAKRRAEKRAAPTRNYGRAHLFSASRLPINAARSQEPLQPPASEFMMDVYISEEYVAKRRAEKRAAPTRLAMAVDGGEEKAGRSRWTASWADTELRKANASVTERRGEDAILAYLSA